MDTATQEPTAPSSGHNGAPTVAPIDPERDIDAKSTIAWLVVSMVFLIVTLYVLGSVFSYSLFSQHVQKIDEAPLNELTQHRASEAFWLANPSSTAEEAAAGASKDADLGALQGQIKATTDQAIQKYVR